MMKKLNFIESRPGPSDNPAAPNAANFGKLKASPNDNLRSLVFENRSKVESPQDWEQKRAEIKEGFDRWQGSGKSS